jgi:type II secretory pathway component PulF
MIMVIGLIVVVCLLAVFIPMLEITGSIDQGA